MKKIDIEELRRIFIEIKHDNHLAFEELYKKYNKLIYRIAYSILKNKQDAEDIVQIVFTKIYSMDKEKLPNSNEASWLYSVTKNETINYLKNRKNNIDLDRIYEMEDDNKEINKIINADSFNRLISKLNENEREIISLKILSNLSFEEIGKVLNVPTGTIKWRYYKSVHTLKLLLSNLTMFIVSFVSSIIILKNKTKSELPIKEDSNIKNNNIVNEDKTENCKDELVKRDDSIMVEDKNSQTQENVIIENKYNNNNYIGKSFIGISVIFFVITIFFSIIFVKYQLKTRKKLSK